METHYTGWTNRETYLIAEELKNANIDVPSLFEENSSHMQSTLTKLQRQVANHLKLHEMDDIQSHAMVQFLNNVNWTELVEGNLPVKTYEFYREVPCKIVVRESYNLKARSAEEAKKLFAQQFNDHTVYVGDATYLDETCEEVGEAVFLDEDFTEFSFK